MRKILLMCAGLVSAPSGVTERTTSAVPGAVTQADPRLHALRAFFAERDCPALAVAHVFLHAADAHGLDWRLLPSISFIESTGGKYAPNNNLFGWDSGKAEFPSPSAAIRRVASSLATSRLYRDKDTDEKLRIYNPYTDYARRVRSVMARISPGE